MPETTAPASTLPTPTPGAQTSEFSLTKLAMIIGTIATILFGLLSQVQGLIPGGSKEAGYIAAALAVCAMALKLASLFGYQSSRTDVKVAAIEKQAQVVAVQVQAAAKASPEAAALELAK